MKQKRKFYAQSFLMFGAFLVFFMPIKNLYAQEILSAKISSLEISPSTSLALTQSAALSSISLPLASISSDFERQAPKETAASISPVKIAALGSFFSSKDNAQQKESSPPDVEPMRIAQSGLPLPRFVSVKSVRMNARVGPGRNYPVLWVYQKRGLPVEIIQEYENWRKIRDSEGDEGWVYQSLLSGKRTATVTPWNKNKTQLTIMREEPYDNSAFVSLIEPGSLATIRQCDGFWCQLDFPSARGWIQQEQLWGVYPGEKIK